ncbi:MAG: sensor histidine kinase [Anaerovoracaceae bacterium]
MKKILSSIFAKYMLAFILVLLLSNIVATIILFLQFGINFEQLRFTIGEGGPQQMTNFAFGFGPVVLVIGGICIFFTTRYLIRPIKDLSEASKQVTEGNFDIKVEVRGDDEVAKLARNFNHMTKALAKNEYLHKDFVSNVSHEFKTPLSSIKGYAKLLKESNLSEAKKQSSIDVIISESERLSELSSNMLMLSQLESDTLLKSKDHFSLSELVREAIVLLQNQWEEKGLKIDVKLEEILFCGDKGLIFQAIVNILGNAIKYSKQGGEIRIRLLKEEKIKLEIADDGIGMNPEEVEKVFDRFYKADMSRNSEGTGLGLSIAKKIMTLHGGTIKIMSEIGKGSKFILEFK